MGQPINYVTVISRFLESVPEYRESPKTNRLADFGDDKDHGQHVVFGGITHFIIEEFRQKRVGPHSAFRRAIEFMEEAMGAEDAEVQNLVWCSFLENLHIAQADYDGIKARLGPKLVETLDQIEKQYGGAGVPPKDQ